MSLSTRVDALAARIAVAVKALRDDPRWTDARTPTPHAGSHAANGPDALTPAAIGAAADSAVVHNTGTETIGGAKTFSIAPQVPVGSLLTHPVRRDDARLTDERAPLAALGNVANGWARLDTGGLLATSVLPPVALVDVTPVSSQAQMLALTAQPGDVAVRSDIGRSFMLRAAPATTLGNWQELLTPTDAVTSVAGKVGSVVLVKADVGLGNVDNTADSAKPISSAQQAALDAKLTLNQVPRAATVGATTNVDGAAAGDMHLTCTANTVITITGTPNGRTLVIDMLASGGARTPSFPTSVALTGGVTSRSLAIASGKVGRAVLRYSTLGSVGWSLDSLYLVG